MQPDVPSQNHAATEPGTAHDASPRGRYLFTLCLTALGVVYGDIGTSPIYSLRESFNPAHGVAPTPQNVLGVLSLIVWSLIIVICIKYLIFVVRADNHGEGGILALTTLVKESPAHTAKGFALVTLLGLFGTALLYGDGMLTPSISVLSAVEGLAVVTSDFKPYVIPITILILVGLFWPQSHGTARVGSLFGPIMALWFATLTALGLMHIVRAPRVLACISPRYAFEFFLRNGFHAFLVLGSVFLVVTGGEALYADIGHFGRHAVRIGWFVLVFPALVINYMGQGALLLQHPKAVVNPFFLMVPRAALVPVVLITTAATVIASQALITGAFSLTMQAVQFGFLPRLRVEQTSATERGQIYVPLVNWTLLVACSLLVIGFGSSSNIAAAYGVAVTLTMVITTMLFFYLTRYAWRWSLLKAGMVCGSFLALELVFFGANILRVMEGGWFPILVGASFFAIMATWKKGRSILGKKFRERTVPLDRLQQQLLEEQVVRVPGTAVFMYSNPEGSPPALVSNLKHNHVVHEKIAIVSVETLGEPDVPPEQQVAAVIDRGQGFYQVRLHYGYMDEPNVPQALRSVLLGADPIDPDQVSYFLGRETVLARPWLRSGMAHWRERLFAILSRNAQDATLFFHIPPERVVELGTQVEI